MAKKGDDRYASFREMRKFIDGLEIIDGIAKPTPLLKEGQKQRKVPLYDVSSDDIEKLLKEWFTIFRRGKIEQNKVDFVLRVFKELKGAIIYEDYFHYIQAMTEWLRLSTTDPLLGDLTIFLLGWCWHYQNLREIPE